MSSIKIPSTGTPPIQKYQCSSVYDEQENRIITYGGYDNKNSKYLSDLSFFDLNTYTWEDILPASSEIPKGTSMQYMHLRSDRFLLIFFGERSNGISSDVFSFDLISNSWKSETLIGDRITGRSNFAVTEFINNQNETFIAFFGGITQNGADNSLFM